MAEDAGDSMAAVQAGRAALSARHGAAAEADRQLTDVLASAHAATVDGLNQLDTIGTEIDGAVRNQAAFAVDTPIGAREFQKFLIAKQREIIAVVAETRAAAAEKTALVELLHSQYTTPAS